MGSRAPALMFTLFLGMAAHAADTERAPIARDDDPVKHPLIAGIFIDAFPEDERADREKITTLTRLVQAMTPEQREAARSALSLEEAKARDPAAFAEISRGYYLLGAHDQSLRLSRALVRENPENLDALRLSAAASFHSEDHESAARDAKAVLDADPDDEDARVIWMFSKDRARAASVRAPSDPFQKKDAETGAAGGGSGAKSAVTQAVTKGLMGNLPIPPSPLEGLPEDATTSDIGASAFTAAATAVGGLLLFMGIGGQKLEEKFPNIRRNMGIGAGVGGALVYSGITLMPMITPLARTSLPFLTNPQGVERARRTLDSPQTRAEIAQFGSQLPQSAAQGARYKEHLRLVREYGEAGYKTLQDGRIRYYGGIDPADKFGVIKGRRFVREWNPATNTYRDWMENIDHLGRVRIVHPKTPPAPHYRYDEAGNYLGKF